VRVPTSILLLGLALLLPGRARAEEPDEPITSRDISRRQIEALHDLEQAETDEEAEAAMERFDEASMLEVRRRRADVDDLIERGGELPPSPRPSDRRP
jgi:hypothetical protein